MSHICSATLSHGLGSDVEDFTDGMELPTWLQPVPVPHLAAESQCHGLKDTSLLEPASQTSKGSVKALDSEEQHLLH